MRRRIEVRAYPTTADYEALITASRPFRYHREWPDEDDKGLDVEFVGCLQKGADRSRRSGLPAILLPVALGIGGRRRNAEVLRGSRHHLQPVS